MSPPELLNTADAKRRLACSKATLYRLVHRGELPPPRKLGSRTKWDGKAVAELAERLPVGLGKGVPRS